MQEKYLPIGSVCTLKGKNKKVMITGYYSVEFNGNFKINDYVGCTYPEGMLLPELVCNFNHTDIESIDFVGYRNEEQRVFDNLLNRLTGNDKYEVEKAAKFHQENDMFLTSNSTYSKILFDENGVVMIADPVVKEEKTEIEESNDWSNIRFDESGTVVSADLENDVINPFYKEYSSFEIQEPEHSDSKNWNIFNNIEFDENGTVISSGLEEDKSSLNQIEFDENGIVISVGQDFSNDETDYSKYRFDENGTLISDGIESLEEEIPPIGPGLPGYVEPVKEPKYKFDENGTLISDGTESLEEEIPPIGPGLPGYVEPKIGPQYKFDEEGNVISE